MNPEYSIHIVSWRQLLLLAVLCCVTFAVFYHVDRYTITGDNLVNMAIFKSRIDNPANTSNVITSENSISLSSIQEDTVGVGQDIQISPTSNFVKVSASINTKGVQTTDKYWDGARVVFVRKDEDGKLYYHEPHLVGSVSGTLNKAVVSKIFTMTNHHQRHDLILELHNASGKAVFTNIEVYGMNLSGSFILMCIVFTILWITSAAWYFYSVTKKNVTSKSFILLALFSCVFIGALVPGEAKVIINDDIASLIYVSCHCDLIPYVSKYKKLVEYGFMYNTGVINVFKFGHLFSFILMSTLLLWLTGGTNRILLVIYMIMLAATTEILQMMVITRSPSVRDVFIDITGIVIGWVFVVLLNRFSHKKISQISPNV